jgi:predicted nucleic acid-binding Zn ribbon protein
MVLIVDINGHPHRKCLVCGELLPLSEFSEHKNNGTLLKRGAVCKSCICKKQSDKIKCIRQFCKKYSSLTNTLKCPVCGKEIGVTKTELKTRKYCSRDCYWKTLTKSWRERSPYAKNIKRIRKEQRL